MALKFFELDRRQGCQENLWFAIKEGAESDIVVDYQVSPVSKVPSIGDNRSHTIYRPSQNA